MNVFLQRLLILFLLAIAVPIQTNAQTTVYKRFETYQNQPYNFNFSSEPNRPSLLLRPTNGTFDWEGYPGQSFVGTYTPNTDFIGEDRVRFLVWEGPFPTDMKIFDMTFVVMAATVEVNPDLGYTFEDFGVSIDVLANDFSSNVLLRLNSVSVSNNGTANFEPGSPFIDFTPAPGFQGEAYINYTACDNAGNCDNGVLTVNVLPSQSLENDTLTLFTKKNVPQAVLVPDLFQVVSEPVNGQYDSSGDIPMYVPNEDFVGTDYLHFTYDNASKLVEIRVLDLEENLFAIDDKAYTAPETSIEFNVLENDTYGLESGCFTLLENPRSGTVTMDQSAYGQLSYQPNAGFRGVDVFTYSVQAPGCVGEPETATVLVYVSTFEPASSKYYMVTPKQTPLVIGNNVPISNFEFRIEDQGELGKAFFMEGEADTTIFGQVVSGNNMILYTPGANVSAGVDEFEVVYCIRSAGGECIHEKSVKIEVEILDLDNDGEPFCIGDCIWAGDTNNDGVVNIADLLPLGLNMGKVGKPRPEATLDVWYGQYGDDWKESDVVETASLDLKHMDTNGDSVITSLDTLALRTFYGRTHSINASEVPYTEHSIRLKGNFVVSPGDLITMDMVLGDSTKPAEDIYGFTFPFRYDPNFFEPESVGVNFSTASFIGYNSPSLQMSHNNQSGLIEAGFTRTDGVKVSGFGEIGTIVSAIIDDLDGFKLHADSIDLTIGGGTATIMNSDGQTFGVDIEEVTVTVKLNQVTTDIPQIPQEDQLIVYPNPTQDVFNIHLNGGQEFERYIIYNMTGQEVYNSGAVQIHRDQVNVSQWASGIYYLNVYTAGGVINKKLEIVKK